MKARADSTTLHYRKLVKILGEDQVRVKVESPFDFIRIASKGVGAAVIKNFSTYFDLSQNQVADILNVSEPTLYRWGRANKDLEKNFSIKLFGVADVFLYGEQVFGSRESFFRWMSLPNQALGGMEPLELISLPGGVSMVKDVIGRIEYGVFS